MRRVSIFRPQTSLPTLLKHPGRRPRREAIAETARRVEMQREPSIDMIDGLIAKLGEKIVLLRETSFKELGEILHNADQIILLAGTFDLDPLTHAARNLRDLCHVFSERRWIDIDAITIHVHAIHLLGSKNYSCPGETANAVLNELDELLDHFGERASGRFDCAG